ncbi:MAG: phage head closure protein [Magnetococcales bacterium]|nr:phage head closure protein [Magnetococcales bacterium]
MMAAGVLINRISLQAKENIRDSVGEVAGDWQEIATVWARITPLSGQAAAEGRLKQTEIPYHIAIRWNHPLEKLTALDSLRAVELFDGRIFKLYACRSNRTDGFIQWRAFESDPSG